MELTTYQTQRKTVRQNRIALGRQSISKLINKEKEGNGQTHPRESITNMGQMKKPKVCKLDLQKERRKRENGSKTIFEEILAANFPKLIKYTKSQIQEILQISCRIITMNTIPKHTIGKLLKSKKKAKNESSENK